MNKIKTLFESEENEFFLKQQEDAIMRAISLKSGIDKLTLDDVFIKLANAEKNSDHMCGFVGLNEETEYKELLKTHIVEKGFVVVDKDGFVTLTTEGKERAKTKLPLPIEQVL